MESTPLLDWIKTNRIADDMRWKAAAEAQINYMTDVGRLLQNPDTDAPWGANVEVISTHCSKSITLPVYRVRRLDLGLAFVMRNNFFNWKLSVASAKPLPDINFGNLFYTTPPVDPAYTGDPLASCYFEGFPEGTIFGYYSNRRHTSLPYERWSAEIHGDSSLWTALFLVLRAAGAAEPLTWHTRESHREEMARQRERYVARAKAAL